MVIVLQWKNINRDNMMNQKLKKLEDLTLKYLKKRPFHNLFITYELDIKGSKIGGTCSDLTLEFKDILEQNGFKSTLHCSLVDGVEIHKLLKVEIDGRFYFIDVGFGWPTIKAFPLDEPIEYFCYGIGFRSIIKEESMEIQVKKDGKEYEEFFTIPFASKSEEEILQKIEDRFSNKPDYPFDGTLLYSFIHEDAFYFIRGDKKFVYRE